MSGQSAASPITTLDDIEFWAGTGANRSALAIDWQGAAMTDNSLVWGFRWEGTAKGVDMLTAIVIADDRLYAKMGPVSRFGFGVVGLGYDINNDGLFSLSDNTSFDEHGISNDVPSDGATARDGDWYAEGWLFENFWNYGIATTSPFDDGNWARSGSGVSQRNLANGSWDSLAYTAVGQQDYAQNPLAAEVSASADFDGDGDVDGRDFLTWQRGGSPDPLSTGDLAAWQANYSSNSLSALPLPPSALNLVIPEPTSLACLCLTAVAWSAFSPCSRFFTWRLNS